MPWCHCEESLSLVMTWQCPVFAWVRSGSPRPASESVCAVRRERSLDLCSVPASRSPLWVGVSQWLPAWGVWTTQFMGAALTRRLWDSGPQCCEWRDLVRDDFDPVTVVWVVECVREVTSWVSGMLPGFSFSYNWIKVMLGLMLWNCDSIWASQFFLEMLTFKHFSSTEVLSMIAALFHLTAMTSFNHLVSPLTAFSNITLSSPSLLPSFSSLHLVFGHQIYYLVFHTG